ncbi:hypothetical protein BDB00DRAFT_841957 [Zychaea mexicana]|uniref:uncharacterized protein n=1 Tax=Zychaea mexicana TaxID=64656 RepID=UPI0022FDC1A0|nr:uncharacterized protein BDB00DRAFT_841957 [Zychaea mexicana]KAI9489674.1 hypothetical protein BDB00DRAFT_841957 [Zychaea mexicana]
MTSSNELPSPTVPTCSKCHQPLGNRLVRALDGTFHPECFTCMDCNAPVAARFFPFTTDEGQTLPLCERDYFRRLGLVCDKCNEALRGPYIIALDKKYHTDHFTCSACSTVFGPEDSYYEHDGQVFCHFHYSTQFAVSCAGCQMAILKQYVEIDRKDIVEHWHPECYMIHKYWNVRIANPSLRDKETIIHHELLPKNPVELAEKQRDMEEKVYRIWTVLSAFEESSAVCISEMLLHVSNGAYVEGICLSERFLVHVEALFSGVDELDKIHHEYDQGEFKYTREAKMLCKKIINFFSLLSRTQEMKRLGITQELLSLVTGLAHYLKILIRVALTTALRLELVLGRPVAVSRLLAKLMEVAGKEGHSRDSQRLVKAKQSSDLCHVCRITVEDQCVKYGELRWHINCFNCRQCKRPLAREFRNATFSSASQSALCSSCAGVHESEVPTPFEYVSKLTQFAYLLRVALSRLCNFLQITDSQLSSVDFSIKTKPYLPKDVPPTKEVSASPTTMQQSKFPTSPVDEKQINTPAYPTHITDVKNVPATNLNRKVSRSFKTAKRSTILGNVYNTTQKTTPISEEDEDNTRSGVPARESSLSGPRLDQHKNLPPLPQEQDEGGDGGGEDYRSKGIRLEDVPDFAKKVTDRPSRHQHTPSTLGTHINVSATTGKPRVYLSELSALQDMIIRHVAVVHIEPYVREHFSLSELLNLIETKKVSIWGKFFTSIMHGGGKKQIKAKEDGTFGVPLDLLTERTGVESNLGASPSPVRVAAFIDDSVTAMRQMDMSVEGIFRKNGNIRRLKDLTEQLDRNPQDVDLFAQPSIQIAALLKKFLRELPDPLMTYKLHGLFTCALKLSDTTACKRVLQLAYCMLPRVNRDALEVLFLFFRWVASFSHVTTDVGSRMDIPNLARVIAPNILTTNSKDPLKDDSFTSISVVEMMLESFDEFCMVPEDLEPFLQDPKFKEGKPTDLSSKDFLKKVEQMMKHSNASSASSPVSTMSSASTATSATANSSVNDVRFLEVQQQQHQYQQHSPTSIYAQQGYLPYPNQHPSSDFRPNQLSMRQSSLNAAAGQPPLK